ncbi:MAG: GTP-sensing pleiotropic transcriptional regulator CodY [Butyribacter sp.]|nr:GTP-sensing pleiotropic transcriptional regulator CodY [bacterium]MDY3855273.1 GTP-sensing pleiotropic transcriptional regulator CodY [Butyribacter sp.]
MSLELLDKTRKLNQLLNAKESETVDFTDFCRILSQTLEVNVVLVSRKGKVLGLKKKKDIQVIPQLEKVQYGDYIEESLQMRFSNILSTQENVNLLTLGFSFENVSEYQAMIAPVSMAGSRLGTLFVYRHAEPFSIDDIILAEYSTTVIGLAMQRAESEETSEEYHKAQDVTAALKTLSRLETKAVLTVLKELDGSYEGILVTSRLADQIGMTRSVIVNALKKCESAGVIQTKSSGMKGTTVKVLNDLFTYDQIKQYMDKELQANE